MDVSTQLELRLYDQLDIASLLLVSIAIPTPFLKFKIFNYYLNNAYVKSSLYHSIQISYTVDNVTYGIVDIHTHTHVHRESQPF